MRLLARSIVLCAFFLSALSLYGQKEDWLPVTPNDLALKQVPGNPGADAVQLYYADFINDQEQSEFFYIRIKVLNEKGNHFGDVEIVVPPDGSLTNLKARTIHPDGKIVDFTGKPFQKTVIKGRGIKVLAKTFTMPDVTVGSIIEYKYKIGTDGVWLNNSWTIQHDLFTVKESFRMKPYSGLLEGFEGGFQVAASSSHMPSNIKPILKSGGYELDLDNMEPFQSEGYMPPEEDFKPQIRFFYVSPDASSPEKFWQSAGRRWNEDAEHFIGNRKEVAQAAAEAIGNETDSEKKLRKLYARAQQIRNLSYERERTDQEQKKEHLKENQNAADVLSRKAGYNNEITRVFVGMARASGFESSIVRVGNRKEKFFDKNVLSSRQLTTEIAVVTVGGKDVYLDPGTQLCPYGYVRWIRTSTEGLKLDKKGGTFVTVPPALYDKAVIERVANVDLALDGTLTGTAIVRFKGGEGLEHRLDAMDSDDAGKKKDLEDELTNWLSSGAIVKLTNVEGWDAIDQPLVATFHIELPSYASAAGKRLLVPAYLFQAKQLDAFKHAERKFPIYFPYAFGEVDRVNMTIPSGYSLESVPQQQTARLNYAGYQNLAQFDGKTLVTQRVLQVNGIFFRLDLYPEFRDFFTKVQAGDEQQVVLREGVTNAQKN